MTRIVGPRLCAALFAVAVVGAALPAAAANAPVMVSKCETSQHPFDVANGYSDAHAPTGAAVNQNDAYGRAYHQPAKHGKDFLGISFTNTTSKTISLVDFGFVVNGKLATEVRDAGSFAPGVAIMHDFNIPNDAYAASGHCVPLQVEFADGTIWKNASLPRM
jgi:hypothetical protein